ncbi:MAG: dihydrofolate reductase family protein [Minisyncoccia bacterium]
MKVTLHMAISIDGFVARKGGDTKWVSDLDFSLFDKRRQEAGCTVMGRTTFDEVGSMEGITTIVVTRNPNDHTNADNTFFAASPTTAVELAKSKGHDKILLAGGGTINGAFLKAGLIDEIFLSVHPVALGDGIKLFGTETTETKLKLLDTEKLDDDLVQLHYEVAK